MGREHVPASQCLLTVMTASSPGAIAVVQLTGDWQPILQNLTGTSVPKDSSARLLQLGEIDQGIVAPIQPGIVQIMPHGGVRVMQRLVDRLLELGATLAAPDDITPTQMYPEARTPLEALMLRTLSAAQSPLAIDLLLAQPQRWTAFHQSGTTWSDQDQQRSERLNRLITPPRVVLAGLPNVGKSTLTNALAGRVMSIAFDMPGTTRDYAWTHIDLAGLTVAWHDTPGLRLSDDPIEQHAIAIARGILRSADLVVAMTSRDVEYRWPTLDRPADVQIVNKCDCHVDPPSSFHHAKSLAISARTGQGMHEFVAMLRERLVPAADMLSPRPWLFDPRLHALMETGTAPSG
jgi:tRNA modification GTPase